MTEPVLTTRDLSKTNGTRPSVKKLNIELERGEILGFLGPNGAGKTTTIRMAVGLIRPTSGRVEVLGHDVARYGARVLPRVGALVESPALPEPQRAAVVTPEPASGVHPKRSSR